MGEERAGRSRCPAVLVSACDGGDGDDYDDDAWDPRGLYSPGELDAEAADLVRTASGVPILWLGEEFEGLRLTRADSRAMTFPGGSGTIITLMYGDCDAHKANPREPSCVPPIQMQVKPPGALIRTENGVPLPTSTASVEQFRGIEAYPDREGLIVEYANGMSITICDQTGKQAELLQALQSANHDALGVPAVGPGEPLAQFTALR